MGARIRRRSGRELITLMGCGSAAGERLPPMILYKGKHLYSTWTINGPPGALYSTSESGWMEKENFFHWFQKCFLPAIKDLLQTGPVVLFLDGHHSHLSTDFLELAKVSMYTPFACHHTRVTSYNRWMWQSMVH